MRIEGKRRTKTGVFAFLCAVALLLTATAAPAAAAPKWQINSLSNTTAQPGGSEEYFVEVRNTGDENMSGEVDLTGTLPAGMSAKEGRLFTEPFSVGTTTGFDCTAGDGGPIDGATDFKCADPGGLEASAVVGAFRYLRLRLLVTVSPGASGTLEPSFEISGGGAPPASTVDPTTIAPQPPGFGLDAFDVAIADAAGEPFTQAGGHPDSVSAYVDFNSASVGAPQPHAATPVEPPRDVFTDLPVGFVGNPTALDACSLGDLLHKGQNVTSPGICPTSSQVGTLTPRWEGSPLFPDFEGPIPLYNMTPEPGVPASFATVVLGTVVTFDARLRQDGSYGLATDARNLPDALGVVGSTVTFWGQPGAAGHDGERACAGAERSPWEGGPTCTAAKQGVFLRNPTSCTGQGMPWALHVDSWFHPGAIDATGTPVLTDPAWKSSSMTTHQGPGYPYPREDWGEEAPVTGCGEVPVRGSLTAKPTALDTETSSGLQVHVEVPNPGIENAEGISASDIKDAKVALPQGLTINPSQAEGLGVCSPAQYESSRLEFHPDGAHGCPSDSKIGTVEVHTQLLKETIPGNVYVAKPYDNPFNSLLALYIVLEEPQRGILIKLPGELRLNEETGRIEGEFDNLPQVPFESFDFKFREGARAPLVTPPICGTYETEAVFTPWSDPSHKLTSNSDFQILHGIGGPCPPGGTPPFKPHFSAGSINNNAGSYTPFDMRITRNDGEQDMTRFSSVLPPGVLGKLAGIAKCPESAIATAKAKTGLQEIANPSCPANSQIGRSVVGAGVGSVLTYIPGQIYLGGPFHGDPLSVIAITPAVAGPFDVGTVVVHLALTLNPKTAEVEVDGSASDPIPHMLKGIPAKLRDLRVYVDRPDFILNPTSCDPSSAKATLFGGGGNPFSSADDVPVALSDRFQAASCSSLGFKPKLALNLKGGTKRGGHPGLRATYRPRKGDADIRGLVVRLPRSAFLDQAHIKTICTRVQFSEGAGNGAECPKGSQYGYIKAWTPLLEEPLEGPVFLRSSNHKLPDLIFALHGLVDIEVDVRIDSAHGGIRASLENSPDAPLSKVFLRMQGAKKSLIINSRNLCGSTNRAALVFEGHNGKVSTAKPEMRAVGCGGKHAAGHHRRQHG